jgi:inorganic triphosphatase YgiF
LKLGRGLVAGLSKAREFEAPAPGGRLDLDLLSAPEAVAAVSAAIGDKPLGPVFETRFRRQTRLLVGPGGAEAELAIDDGEICAGGRRAVMREAELELKSGDPRDLFTLAKALFGRAPLRLSRRNKAARGYALAAGDEAVAPAPPVVNAAKLRLASGLPVEAAARDVLLGCLDQIGGNIAATVWRDEPEATHQLRVGLRRFRTAASLFRGALGGPALAALDAEARAIAAEAGAARDLDVLIDELLTPLADRDSGFARLIARLNECRAAKRAALKARLSTPETAGFVFDLGAFVECRGWLRPSDYGQTAALAAPVDALAAEALETRWRKAAKRARHIATLGEDDRHDLRKRLKKLRYAIEFFAGVYPEKPVRKFLKRLRALQNDFGALQDLATARVVLLGEDAPAADDPAAQRAAGMALGLWERDAEAAFASAQEHWRALSESAPFWR